MPSLIGILFFAAVTFVMCGFASRVDGQERQPVLDCLGDVEAPMLFTRQVTLLDNEAWQRLRETEGRSIWIGYENGGFDVPDDLRMAAQVRGRGERGEIMVWIYQSPSTPEYSYWFVFASIVPFADGDGDHYGVHPCGAFRVEGG